MTNVARRNAALAEVARQAVTAAGWSTDPTTEGRAMPPTSDNTGQQDHIGSSAATDEPWCPEHGYGCEPQNCPCGHSLRCDCWDIANEH